MSDDGSSTSGLTPMFRRLLDAGSSLFDSVLGVRTFSPSSPRKRRLDDAFGGESPEKLFALPQAAEDVPRVVLGHVLGFDADDDTHCATSPTSIPSTVSVKEDPQEQHSVTGTRPDNATRANATDDEPRPHTPPAVRMMRQMGHVEGGGLGRHGQGITSPIKPNGRVSRPGLHPGLGLDPSAAAAATPSRSPLPTVRHTPPPRAPLNAKPLDPEQQRALAAAIAGHNLFLTGGAGTGKSFTLKAIISALVELHGERHVAVTASTGAASVHVDGQTLHSLAGVGVPQHVSDFGRMWSGQKALAWKELKVLIVDEVSMLDAEYLDHLSMAVDRIVNWHDIDAARKASVERAAAPFGGRIQLIFTGDFMQLSPVKRDAASARRSALPCERLASLKDAPMVGPRGGAPAPPFHALETHGQPAFKSVCWREAKLEVVVLSTQHRQQQDTLLAALNHVREGRVHEAAVKALLQQTRRPLETQPRGEEPIRLFCTNAQCDQVNEQRLMALVAGGAETVRYVAKDTVEVDRETVQEELLAGGDEAEVVARLEEELWQNHFREHHRRGEREDPKYDEASTYAVGAQVMLIQNEPPGGFVNGDRGEVVAFRHATEEEIERREADGRALLPGEAAQKYPLVRFHRTNRHGEDERLVLPADARRRLYRVGLCVRRGLPLRHAWAITVHKSQGMSLPRLVVELGNAFAEGQCYVALSRATSLDGLQCTSFSHERVRISHDALRFHEALRLSSEQCSPAPLDAYWARTHFWWKNVLEGPGTHTAWPDVYRDYGRSSDRAHGSVKDEHEGNKGGTCLGTEFARWERTYPVPDRLRRLR